MQSDVLPSDQTRGNKLSNYSLKLKQFLQESIEKELLSRCEPDFSKSAGSSAFCIKLPPTVRLTNNFNEKQIFYFRESLFPKNSKSNGSLRSFKPGEAQLKNKSLSRKESKEFDSDRHLQKDGLKRPSPKLKRLESDFEFSGSRVELKIKQISIPKLKVEGVKRPVVYKDKGQRQQCVNSITQFRRRYQKQRHLHNSITKTVSREVYLLGNTLTNQKFKNVQLINAKAKKLRFIRSQAKSGLGSQNYKNRIIALEPTVVTLMRIQSPQQVLTGKGQFRAQMPNEVQKDQANYNVKTINKKRNQLVRAHNLRLPLEDKLNNCRIYYDFLDAISFSNYMAFECKTIPSIFISKKNNGDLVKSILRSRQWLSIRTQFTPDINFVWSSRIKSNRSKSPLKLLVSNQQIQTLRDMGRKNQHLNRVLNTQQHKKYLGKPPPYFYGYSHQFVEDSSMLRFQNILPNSKAISTKKGLFHSLSQFYKMTGKCLSQIIPLTYHIESHLQEQILAEVSREVGQGKCLWIVKPGEGTNRGKGIFFSKSFIKILQQIKSNPQHTFIIQKYIENPMLYNRRKFDIRAYMLITMVHGCVKAYFYQEGYVRTSSYEFSLESLDEKIHLTNDAMQSQFQGYGKFESANKLTLAELDSCLRGQGLRLDKVWGRVREISRDIVRSSYKRLGAEQLQVSFELFGLDFMIDQTGKVYLIEVNSNPCLATTGSILSVIIPRLLENTFRVGLDPILPPQRKRVMGSSDRWWQKDTYEENRFVLIFDSMRSGG